MLLPAVHLVTDRRLAPDLPAAARRALAAAPPGALALHLREKDLGGLAIDTKSKLKDGTEFDGIDGLRNYLLTKKKDVVVRLFCRRLLGYALGRAVTLSDTALLDEMVSELNKNDGKVSAALQAIVRSPQFRMVRGSEFGE